jgi:hypothetical protein
MKDLIRLFGRVGVVLLVSSCVLLIVVQYYHIIRYALTLTHELSETRRDIADLRALRVRQMSDIRRLSDPHGAIPDIHDRLRLVAPNEMLIYVEGVPTPVPSSLP